jgi:hypothetical protein
MVTEVPLRTSITPAMAIGGGLDLAINFSALALIFLSTGRAGRWLLGKKKAPSNS